MATPPRSVSRASTTRLPRMSTTPASEFRTNALPRTSSTPAPEFRTNSFTGPSPSSTPTRPPMPEHKESFLRKLNKRHVKLISHMRSKRGDKSDDQHSDHLRPTSSQKDTSIASSKSSISKSDPEEEDVVAPGYYDMAPPTSGEMQRRDSSIPPAISRRDSHEFEKSHGGSMLERSASFISRISPMRSRKSSRAALMQSEMAEERRMAEWLEMPEDALARLEEKIEASIVRPRVDSQRANEEVAKVDVAPEKLAEQKEVARMDIPLETLVEQKEVATVDIAPEQLTRQKEVARVDIVPEMVERKKMARVDNVPEQLAEQKEVARVDIAPKQLGEQKEVESAETAQEQPGDKKELESAEDAGGPLDIDDSFASLLDISGGFPFESTGTAPDSYPEWWEIEREDADTDVDNESETKVEVATETSEIVPLPKEKEIPNLLSLPTGILEKMALHLDTNSAWFLRLSSKKLYDLIPTPSPPTGSVNELYSFFTQLRPFFPPSLHYCFQCAKYHTWTSSDYYTDAFKTQRCRRYLCSNYQPMADMLESGNFLCLECNTERPNIKCVTCHKCESCAGLHRSWLLISWVEDECDECVASHEPKWVQWRDELEGRMSPGAYREWMSV